jgi:hypothetical protein
MFVYFVECEGQTTAVFSQDPLSEMQSRVEGEIVGRAVIDPDDQPVVEFLLRIKDGEGVLSRMAVAIRNTTPVR